MTNLHYYYLFAIILIRIFLSFGDVKRGDINCIIYVWSSHIIAEYGSTG